MTKNQAVACVEYAKANGMEIEHRTDYSGRGMFGKTTHALVGYEGEIKEALSECGIKADKMRWDSMGKSDVVCY